LDPDPDSHQSDKLDPTAHQFAAGRPKGTNMSTTRYSSTVFKALGLYFEAKIRIRIKVKGSIRIRIKVKGNIRIRVLIKVTSWIRIRNNEPR
jgi:hypothetical protein